MAIPVNSIIASVSKILNDESNVRWTKPELVDWLNHGQREIVLFKPNACVINVDVELVPGTKQSLPAGGNSLIDVPRNTGGNAVTIAVRNLLDLQVPDWHSMARKSAKVIHYFYSITDPKTFYVYPPSPGGNKVEISYNANPSEVAIGGVISLDDIYSGALIDYMAYRAFSKDSEETANEQTASIHYQAFIAAIGGKSKAEKYRKQSISSTSNQNEV